MDTLYDWFITLSPVMQALIATTGTWLLTAAGASLVFLFKTMNRQLLDGMLGFTGGVMIAASFWSLLAPAIEITEQTNPGVPSWLPAALGFVGGALFLFALDKLLPHLHINFPVERKEGVDTNLKSPVLLVLAITLHNIPDLSLERQTPRMCFILTMALAHASHEDDWPLASSKTLAAIPKRST